MEMTSSKERGEIMSEMRTKNIVERVNPTSFMSNTKTPRNIPCPCGSGIKSKRCCNGDETKMETSKNGIQKFREYCFEVSKELNMSISNPPTNETQILMSNDNSMISVRRDSFRINGKLVFGLYGLLIRVKDELQGQGIGTNIMKIRTEISKKYPFPLFLIPSVVDYEDDIYRNSKRLVENWDWIKDEDKDVSKEQLNHIKGQHKQIISNYESVDDTIRPRVKELKNQQLEKFYKRIGYEFVVYDEMNRGLMMMYNKKNKEVKTK